jgi:NAD(P)-dependent dehydrogenase (short-subunit alcohol dehydrogenase family)
MPKQRAALITGGIAGLGTAVAKPLNAARYRTAVTNTTDSDKNVKFSQEMSLPHFVWEQVGARVRCGDCRVWEVCRDLFQLIRLDTCISIAKESLRGGLSLKYRVTLLFASGANIVV